MFHLIVFICWGVIFIDLCESDQKSLNSKRKMILHVMQLVRLLFLQGQCCITIIINSELHHSDVKREEESTTALQHHRKTDLHRPYIMSPFKDSLQMYSVCLSGCSNVTIKSQNAYITLKGQPQNRILSGFKYM